MKANHTQINQELNKLCANYYRAITPELLSLFCESFDKFEENVFKKSVKWWIENNESKMPNVAQLKKKCWEIKGQEERKAAEFACGGVENCGFGLLPKKNGYLECEISRKLCCKNDFRIHSGGVYLCEFHYELRQEWCGISSRHVTWVGLGMPWTQAKMLKYEYENGGSARQGEILMSLSTQHRDHVMKTEHLTWQRENGKTNLSDIFKTIEQEISANDQKLVA